MSEQQQTEERPFGGFSGGATYDGGLRDNSYYDVTLAGIKSRNLTTGQWPGWKVVWSFAIKGSSETLEAMTSEATGEASTAGPWLIVLVGQQRYDERETRKIMPDELIGREAMVLVKFNERGWPKVGGLLPCQPPAINPVPVAAVPPPAAPAPTPVASAPEPPNDFDDLPF